MAVFFEAFGFFLCLAFILAFVFTGVDFAKFVRGKRKQEKTDALKCDSGGILFVQGNKTYYNMPNGERRKIADFAMDLTPGSPDMREFTLLMEQARKEHDIERSNDRKAAKLNMVKVAKEVTQ